MASRCSSGEGGSPIGRSRWRAISFVFAGVLALYLCGYGALRLTGIFDAMWLDEPDGTTRKEILGTGWGPPTRGNRLRTEAVGGLYDLYRPVMAVEAWWSRRAQDPSVEP